MATKKKIAIVTGQDAEAPPLSLDAEPAPEPRMITVRAPHVGAIVQYCATDPALIDAPRLFLPLVVVAIGDNGRNVAGWMWTVPGMKRRDSRSGFPVDTGPQTWVSGTAFDIAGRPGTWRWPEHALAEAQAIAAAEKPSELKLEV